MKYRLGIDLGTTSLGWCVLKLDKGSPIDIVDMGIRIFDDGRDAKSKEPLAVTRRTARSIRRRLERYKRRRQNLMNALIKAGLMPKDILERKNLEKLDPYALRTRGLDEKLALFEFGRAIFQLNQRRGFKSNRKSDKKMKETGPIKEGIKNLRSQLESTKARTLGEYLFQINVNKSPEEQHLKQPIRIKHNIPEWNVYPERSMYEDEFNKLWGSQSHFHDQLTEALRAKLQHIIFYQRPLKPQIIGLCTFEAGEKRAPLAHPLTQQFRIFQEVANLELTGFSETGLHLTPEQKNHIADMLCRRTDLFTKDGKFAFSKIRRELKLPKDSRFNLETESRTGLQGDHTAYTLAKDDCFGEAWFRLKDIDQNAIVEKLLSEENDKELVQWLKDHCQLEEQNALTIADVILDDGYGHVSLKAIQNILPHLRSGMTYSNACKAAGYHHSDHRPDEILSSLPYYGEAMPKAVIGGSFNPAEKQLPEKYFGKINNPTVHIALNQLRKFINSLIATYGAPEEIVVELARELKLGQKRLDEVNKTIRDNTARNEKIATRLQELGVPNSYENRMRYRLWEDLSIVPTQRCCPFTGKIISQQDVFTPEFEIEHILPFSRTFDDGASNKVLSFRQANRDKGNRSPFEAFGTSPTGYDWEAIQARAQRLPPNKHWRFEPSAMEKFEKDDGYIARQLTDTQYMARVAKEYLQFICNANNVWGIPGQLTALLRTKWGVNLDHALGAEENIKNRDDHRHHAIDAFVVACITRKNLELISQASNNPERRDRLVTKMPPPYAGFEEQGRERLACLLEGIVVSHKPDHKDAPAAITKHAAVVGLHNDTVYRIEKKPELFIDVPVPKGKVLISVKKPLVQLNYKKIKDIADRRIRKELEQLLSKAEDGNAKQSIIQSYADELNIRRIKILEMVSETSIVNVNAGSPKPARFMAPGGNYCAEIYGINKGPRAGKWGVEVITNFQAHDVTFIPAWHRENPTAKLIMRLFINDMVAWDENGSRVIKRVRKMNQDGRLFFEDHNVAFTEEDTSPASVKQLQERNTRKISVDILGKIKDPGKAPTCPLLK